VGLLWNGLAGNPCGFKDKECYVANFIQQLFVQLASLWILIFTPFRFGNNGGSQLLVEITWCLFSFTIS
jgi:hypothetical protein